MTHFNPFHPSGWSHADLKFDFKNSSGIVAVRLPFWKNFSSQSSPSKATGSAWVRNCWEKHCTWMVCNRLGHSFHPPPSRLQPLFIATGYTLIKIKLYDSPYKRARKAGINDDLPAVLKTAHLDFGASEVEIPTTGLYEGVDSWQPPAPGSTGMAISPIEWQPTH